jgi:hypothetical protein
MPEEASAPEAESGVEARVMLFEGPTNTTAKRNTLEDYFAQLASPLVCIFSTTTDTGVGRTPTPRSAPQREPFRLERPSTPRPCRPCRSSTKSCSDQVVRLVDSGSRPLLSINGQYLVRTQGLFRATCWVSRSSFSGSNDLNTDSLRDRWIRSRIQVVSRRYSARFQFARHPSLLKFSTRSRSDPPARQDSCDAQRLGLSSPFQVARFRWACFTDCCQSKHLLTKSDGAR